MPCSPYSHHTYPYHLTISLQYSPFSQQTYHILIILTRPYHLTISSHYLPYSHHAHNILIILFNLPFPLNTYHFHTKFTIFSSYLPLSTYHILIKFTIFSPYLHHTYSYHLTMSSQYLPFSLHTHHILITLTLISLSCFLTHFLPTITLPYSHACSFPTFSSCLFLSLLITL